MGSLLRFRVVRTAEGLSGGTAAMGIIQEYPQIFGWTPLQRFWISGPDLGIAADFARGLALGLQRFLISGGQLGNRCKVFPVYTLFRASILDFRPRLGNHCSVSSLQRRMARLQRP